MLSREEALQNAEGALIEALTEDLLSVLNFEVTDPGFIDTPRRVASFWLEFTQRSEPEIRAFPSDSTDLITLEGYETWGLCPHHLLPVKYTIDICYIPDGQVFGISKLPRIVDYCLRTLPLQEDLPSLICKYIDSKLPIKYCRTTVKGTHLCMVMRGIKARDCTLTTSCILEKDRC